MRAERPLDVTERVRKGTHEGIEYRKKEPGLREKRRRNGIADLCLVQPALGVFAGDVEPDGRRVRAGP